MGPFATATELSEWVGLAVPADLARLQALLASASALIRGATGQVLSEVSGDVIVVQPEFDSVTGWRNPPPRAVGGVIYLPERPVTAITEILVDAVAFTDFTFTSDGIVQRTDGKAWDKAATITYDHGYAETSEEFKLIRTICMEATLRAYAPNASGSPETLSSIAVESAGYAPLVFLTDNEMWSLPGGQVAVG